MKLRYLKRMQLMTAVLILAMPVLKTVTRTGVRVNGWFYLFEAVCMVTLFLCRRAYRCPHCQNQLEIIHTSKCPHCSEPLDE